LRLTVGILCGLALLIGTHGAASGQPPVLEQFQETLVETIAEAEPAVVSLAVIESPAGSPAPVDADPFEFITRGDGRGTVPSRFGSGVIVRVSPEENAFFVLTNEHLVERSRREAFRSGSHIDAASRAETPLARRIAVRLASRHTFRAAVHAADPRSDLAILRVDLDGSGLDPGDVIAAEFGDADRIRKGSLVIALGNPYAIARDGSCSASLGIVSNVGRAAPRRGKEESADEQIHTLGTLLHVDARLDLGTSGGALIDLNGKLVGLTTSLAALEGYETTQGFAIPLTPPVRRIIESLLNGLEAEYGFLGITPDTTLPGELVPLRSHLSQPTAPRANRVASGSPADRGGVRPQDLIVQVDGETMFTSADLVRAVGLLGPETEVELSLFRPRERAFATVRVQLGKWPVYDDTRIVSTRERHPPWRGLHVDYPTGRRRYLPSSFLSEYVRAVVITHVQPESPAAKAGLKPGQFIQKVQRQPVETPAEFHDAVRDRTGIVRVTLRDGTEVDIPETSP
jgi:serine protease Do